MQIVRHTEYETRAMAAYFRQAKREGVEFDQPRGQPDVWTDGEGKMYVVLYNGRGILAVYRVRNDGILKRLKRWPHFPEYD